MKIAFLNAYNFDLTQEYQARYSPLMIDFLERCWPDSEIEMFEAGQGHLPEEKDLKKFDLWVIGGSSKSCYESDEWIHHLKAVTKEVHSLNQKILGICFGHQLIAETLGGTVEKFSGGWEVGTHSMSLHDNASKLLVPQKEVSLLYSHQDQVITLPDGAENLASNSFCKHQMYQIGQQVLGIQGDPEFTEDYLRGRLDSRRELLGESVYLKGVDSLTEPRDENLIIGLLRRFFLAST